MGKVVKVVLIIFLVLTMVDAGFLIRYLVTHSSLISKTSFARLITFVLTHFYFAFMLGVLHQEEDYIVVEMQVYRYSQWLVNTFVPLAVIDTLVEIGMFLLIGTQRHVHTEPLSGQLKEQQLHLINFYFMSYMYFTIIGVLSAIHLCVNKVLERMEMNKYQDLIDEILDKFLQDFNRNDPIIKEAECSICQAEFLNQPQNARNTKIPIVNLECNHMFHKDCILEWVKKTYEESIPAKCPNCRRPINE